MFEITQDLINHINSLSDFNDLRFIEITTYNMVIMGSIDVNKKSIETDLKLYNGFGDELPIKINEKRLTKYLLNLC